MEYRAKRTSAKAIAKINAKAVFTIFLNATIIDENYSIKIEQIERFLVKSLKNAI